MRLAASGHMHDTLHENARRMDAIRVEFARLDQILDLGDGHLPAVAITGLKFRAVFR